MNLSALKPEYVEVDYSIHAPTYFDSGDFSFPGETERAAFYGDCRRIFEAAAGKLKG